MRTRAITTTLQNHSLFALQHANMRSIIGGMEYRQTDGKTRRVHKQYVDVVARILAGGQVVPVTVCWVDGRCFTIDEIVSSTGFGLTVHGVRTATYKVRFGGARDRAVSGGPDARAGGRLAGTRDALVGLGL